VKSVFNIVLLCYAPWGLRARSLSHRHERPVVLHQSESSGQEKGEGGAGDEASIVDPLRSHTDDSEREEEPSVCEDKGNDAGSHR
jgi:hypothetical protein